MNFAGEIYQSVVVNILSVIFIMELIVKNIYHKKNQNKIGFVIFGRTYIFCKMGA